ncbi:hypothetical protein Daura_20825 [Dactylosporangium aurantiacum]|uniref:Uncharacterized protein n=1 Tax=Dactylosporangium aurantiacum TaxID=35754 RepID=A0A9Q9MKX7_9ACTN|nr:hypothetical protein [Dactylosporangium aurantiacum]MDG6110008.1 hypothetical protein [Dactylosporangium aurantiacum]UWZ58405.1 hypothetical protein Daura_20825 [Dactylosporangium aurantiacum]
MSNRTDGDLRDAGAWLAGHGLGDVEPTPLLAARLAVRRRARLAGSILLAVFLCAVALAYVSSLPDGAGRGPLLALTSAVVALVLGQSLLDRWVRRADRRAAATLPRRAAHPVRLGWRTLLGPPRAALALITYAGAAAMAVRGLVEPDAGTRFAAVVLLIGLAGVAAAAAVQLRHILTHPTVADDEASLTADVILRVEDAREVATPTAVWSLPVVSVFATAPGWWVAAWMVFIVATVAALVVVNARTAGSGTVARHATNAG